MILKFFEINKINLNINKIILFYGKNEGLKKESINLVLKNLKKTSTYDEREILEDSKTFLENISSKSLFEKEKTIIIQRATDKIMNILEEISSKNYDDIIIINANNLEKKSKLRSFFEKSKKHVCVAFYPDNQQTLLKLGVNFFQKKNISISQSNINLIVNKCNGERENLNNELKKIEQFSQGGKKITTDNLVKLINLSENYSISELVDNCLVQNEKKTIGILNENNFSNEDCILIARTFLIKAKKILKLSNQFEKNKDIDLTIESAKPPIFWKEKEIIKEQVFKWKPNKIKELIYKISEIELHIKNNVSSSIYLITNFLIEQCTKKTNNKI